MNPKRWTHLDIEQLDFNKSLRRCDSPGCQREGEYRAPKSRSNNHEYYQFCLDHVQSYNRSWNYYDGMDADAIEQSRREDLLWQRSTWPFAAGRKQEADTAHLHGYAFKDSFGLFDEGPNTDRQQHEREIGERLMRSLPKEISDALKTLDLAPPVTPHAVKQRYKELAKQLHPDLNRGDSSSEDRLKKVNQAYSVVKTGVAVGD